MATKLLAASRAHRAAALIAFAIVSSPLAIAQSSWDGSTAGWFNLVNDRCMHWSTCKPNGTGTPGEAGNTFNVAIGSGAVTLNGGAVILDVTVGSGATLTGVTTSYLQFDTHCGACALLNNGTVTFNDSSYININTSSLTISGAGTVRMATANSTIASSPGIGATLINQETIQGQGQIGKGETAITNQGTINANVTGGTLIVQPDNAGLRNSGVLEASNGGTLNIISGFSTTPFNNAGGTIKALNGSSVMNAAGVITGGTLTTSGTGVIESSNGANPTLHNLTNAGAYVIPLNNLATLEGTINDTGTIAVGSSAGNGIMYIEGNVTLSGSGTVTLVDAGIAQSSIHSLAAGAQFTNQNTVQGAGVIGDAGLTVLNQGAIMANAHDPLAFTDAGFTNAGKGLVQATHGAILNIFSKTFNNQGTLRVDPGSTIDFNGNYKLLNYSSTTNTLTGGTYIVGGTLQFNNAANGIIAIKTNAANLTLNGASAQILDALNGNALGGLATNAAAGSFTIENGRNFTSAGAFLNSGTLTVGGSSAFNAGAGGTGVYDQSGASSATTILQGGALHAGTLNFTGGTLNVFGTLDPLNLHVCGTCRLTGTGTVVANVSSDGAAAPGSATGPGTLSINGGYSQGTAGELVIDLAGANAGKYSVLNVSGHSGLGGTVDFVATGGFHPGGGEDFTFLLFGSESGSFRNVLFTNWTCPSGDKCTEVLTSHSLSLEISGKGGGGGGTGVPEPPAWLLGLTGLIALIAFRRPLRRAPS
jgi:hypothetical protein